MTSFANHRQDKLSFERRWREVRLGRRIFAALSWMPMKGKFHIVEDKVSSGSVLRRVQVAEEKVCPDANVETIWNPDGQTKTERREEIF